MWRTVSKEVFISLVNILELNGVNETMFYGEDVTVYYIKENNMPLLKHVETIYYDRLGEERTEDSYFIFNSTL